MPIGYAADAKDRSDKTHRLPPPPNAKGQKNYRILLDEMVRFMGDTKPLPPLFTTKEEIPVIKSFINEFCADGSDDPDRFRVWPLHQLFFNIKEEAVKYSPAGESIKSIFVAETLLNRDTYVYATSGACNVSFSLIFCDLEISKLPTVTKI